MKRLIPALLAVLLLGACDKEQSFSCKLLSMDVEQLTPTSATLTAVVEATDYAAIERMGFCIARQGSEEFDWLATDKGRIISLKVEELRPATAYDYRVYVMAAGDSWTLPIESFTTPAEGDNGGGNGGGNEGGNEGGNDEKPIAGTTYRAGWYELPREADGNGDGCDDNNDSYYYAHHLCDGDERNAQGTGRARNYSVCFSADHHCPVWVAAPLHAMYKGSAKRTEAYTHDPQIPSNIQYNYKDADSGCNNGHMLGSADRTSSVATNRQVFYFSNIAPQNMSTFNTGGGAWNNLESHIDGLVCRDTLYTVIGCYFDRYTDSYGNVATPERISFGGRNDVSCPTMFYYALLRTKSGATGKSVAECSAEELQCAAFVMSHEQQKGHEPQAGDLITIEELERLTGFTYFDNVPNAPKGVLNTGDWL